MFGVAPIWARIAAVSVVVAFVFGLGVRAASWYWSTRYEKLQAAHAEQIREQRHRLLAFQDRVNIATAQRERGLLAELEDQRIRYEELQQEISEATLVEERLVIARPDCPEPDIDWAAFGRLFDAAAARRPAAEVDPAGRSDADGGTSSASRN